MTPAAVVKAWVTHADPNNIETRDAMLATLKSRDIYPSAWSHDRERRAGLYPDIMDPDFATRLYSKTEFSDLQSGATAENACSTQGDFDHFLNVVDAYANS